MPLPFLLLGFDSWLGIYHSENCAVLGYYAASQEYKKLLGFLTLEIGTDGLFRNFGKELPPLAA